MTAIEMLEKRLEVHRGALNLTLTAEQRTEIETRIRECQNIIYILTANKLV